MEQLEIYDNGNQNTLQTQILRIFSRRRGGNSYAIGKDCLYCLLSTWVLEPLHHSTLPTFNFINNLPNYKNRNSMLMCSCDRKLILRCMLSVQIFQEHSPKPTEIKIQDFHGHLSRSWCKMLHGVNNNDRVKS